MSPFSLTFVLYPTIRKKIKSTDTKKRPKAFYQFWASNVVILALIVYTLVKNLDDIMQMTTIISALFSLFNAAFYNGTIYRVCVKKGGGRGRVACTCSITLCMSCTFYTASLALLLTAICLFLVLTPALIFIYYLHPTQTLIRLTFTINSILYTNSLLALLLYQCERSAYMCIYKLVLSKHTCQLFLTICILSALVSFIFVINDLFKLHQNHFTSKSDVETLILLVPTLTNAALWLLVQAGCIL